MAFIYVYSLCGVAVVQLHDADASCSSCLELTVPNTTRLGNVKKQYELNKNGRMRFSIPVNSAHGLSSSRGGRLLHVSISEIVSLTSRHVQIFDVTQQTLPPVNQVAEQVPNHRASKILSAMPKTFSSSSLRATICRLIGWPCTASALSVVACQHIEVAAFLWPFHLQSSLVTLSISLKGSLDLSSADSSSTVLSTAIPLGNETAE